MKKFLLSSLLIFCTTLQAASIDKAQVLKKHDLIQEAKLELVDVLFSKSSDTDKAEALYILGTIAFEEGKINNALDSWVDLVKRFPSSEQATIVKTRIDELSNIAGLSAQENIDNAVAQAYLKNADFWSDDRSKVFVIDSSWIPKVEAALEWYDQVITEFPNSTAAKVAYQEKMKTLLGWKERGQYASSYGIRNDFKKYMPILLETFNSFIQSYPDAATAQAFRYQIAQSYWSQKDWVNTRKWLNEIIEMAGDKDNFYSATAKLRLQKVEY
jgi:tetratricopeptide (TPR) repeat protein